MSFQSHVVGEMKLNRIDDLRPGDMKLGNMRRHLFNWGPHKKHQIKSPRQYFSGP